MIRLRLQLHHLPQRRRDPIGRDPLQRITMNAVTCSKLSRTGHLTSAYLGNRRRGVFSKSARLTELLS
jgi:hypothetical protein